MAATDSRTGFRLPWSTEEKATGQRADVPQDADRPSDGELPEVSPEAPVEAAVEAVEAPTPDETISRPTPADPAPEPPPIEAVVTEEDSVQPTATPDATTRSRDAAPKKPTKFLADLTRAMQAAAESSRSATLEQFQTEAKAHVEQVHARSADEAAELRKTADDDIITIRDWSKAELARIREETERRISTRKADLDIELEEHAARIEREIERVQGRVAGFEAEMDKFFERLLTEDDPAEFAAMAENLPEPPPFDFNDDRPVDASATTATIESPEASVAEEPEVAPAEAIGSPEPETAHEDEHVETTAIGASEGESIGDGPAADGDEVAYAVQDDPAAVEAAMAAIEAAYRAADGPAAGDASPATDEPAPTQVEADDPRLAALNLTQDLDAAEAEAAAAAADTSDEEIPTIDDDALAARLAGLVPEGGSGAPMQRAPAPKAAANSQVVVTGLVSVASIASFKRHLGRISGVQSVGVSSGPDGEFVFKVAHGADVVLADAIPSLPGFEARVTGTGEGVVNVSARDPESEG